MKTRILLTTVALACYGCSPLFGQIQLLPGHPSSAPRLVANQSGTGGISGLDDLVGLAEETPSSAVPPVKPSIPNPFNFVPAEVDDLIDVSPSDRYLSDVIPSEVSSSNRTPSNQAGGAAGTDPNSLPVGRHTHQREIVDTIGDYSMLENIPHYENTQVSWNHRTPNPVADSMLRQHCVNGLWDSYPAQRALECMRIQERLAGHACGHCGTAGSCGTCGCGTSAMPRNRYREQSNQNCPNGACDAGQGIECAATLPAPTRSPVSTASHLGRPTNVASLPSTSIR